MKVVLLSGGSGKRLWPISNEDKPKQFIKYGTQRQSMLQKNYELLKKLNYDISITSVEKYNELIKEQLGISVDIIKEPDKRDTFPAIANSIVHLLYNNGMEQSEYVAFLPVDACVEEEFYKDLEKCKDILEKNNKNIGLIGIKPKKPSCKYGYIVPKEKCAEYIIVDRFKEKPNIEEAKQLLEKGAIINSGIFIIKASYILNFIEKYIKYNTYDEFEEQYNMLPRTSFDYEVLEKEKDLIAFESNSDWNEIGSWETFIETLAKDKYGNVFTFNDKDTTIINELDIPILSIGNNNLLIAASKEGILICDKSESDKLKEYLKNIEGNKSGQS